MEIIDLKVKLPSNWEPRYFESGRSFVLPPTKYLMYTRQKNQPIDIYLNGGVSSVGINVGAEESLNHPNRTDIFIPNPLPIKEYALGALGGKPLRQFSKIECENFVDGWINSRYYGCKVFGVISGMAESTPGADEWCKVTDTVGPYIGAPDQVEWIDMQMAKRIRERGGEYFGEYDGCIRFTYAMGNAQNTIQNALNSNDGLAAYNLAKASQNAGSGNTFFTKDAWKYRGGMVLIPPGAAHTDQYRLTQSICEIEVAIKALKYLGASNTRMAAFMLLAKQEAQPMPYNRQMAGGYLQNYSFTIYSSKYQMASAYLAWALGMTDVYCWEDAFLRGNDPNVIPYDAVNQDGFPTTKYYGNGNPARKGTPSKYDPSGAAYFEHTIGEGHDAMMITAEHYSKMVRWAGINSAWAKIRAAGASSYPAMTGDYALQQLNTQRPLVRMHKDGNRRALFIYDVNNPAGTRNNWEIDVDGENFPFTVEAGIPYFLLGNITGGQQ